MTKRLQVLFEDGEYAALQAAAASRSMTVAEWVRQALAQVRRESSTADVERKLAAIRTAVRHAAPTGPIERLTADIDRGYAAGPAPEGLSSPGNY
jgi:2-oxo-4-hydroxy-4-carboxy--5-ureidoimidazoline (OHCU) decarboxylase